MSNLTPNDRWPKARRARASAAKRKGRWFPIALVVLSLGAFSAVFFAPTSGGDIVAEPAVPIAGAGDREEAYFPICSGPKRITCVVDGDTIWYRGSKIRIADIDTPEVSKPGCANEAALGRKATVRLQVLLNEGPFSLEPNPEGRSEDDYGRSLMLVTRGGDSLGAVLVGEGLAEQWGGPRKAWC